MTCCIMPVTLPIRSVVDSQDEFPLHVAYLPEDVQPYVGQVAGHAEVIPNEPAILRHLYLPILFKYLQNQSRGFREWQFYELIFNAKMNKAIRSLRPFIPKYYGLFQSPRSDALYLGLVDKLARFERPNACDLKMGTVTYRITAPLEKQLREQSKYAWRRELGFVLCGIRVFDPTRNEYTKRSKEFCNNLTPDGFYSLALMDFLGPDPVRRIRLARAYIDELNPLIDWFKDFSITSKVTFCRTSLLMGHDSLKSRSDVTDCPVIVSLIDFTDWAMSTADTPSGSEDLELSTGFLHGLCTLVSMLNRVIREH